MHSARRVVAGALLLGLGGLTNVAEARASSPPRAAVAESDAYRVELKLGPAYRTKDPGSFQVVIVARGGYHLNPQFPIRWKADEPPENVTYDRPVLKRDDGRFTEGEGSFQVGFVAAKSGVYKLGGTVSLSLCNEKSCVMEKVAVDSDVTVK